MTQAWQDRAIAATHGNGSQFGAILLCALDRNVEDSFPQFTSTASVTSDGYVMCNFIDKNGDHHLGAFVGALSGVRENETTLAEHLKLDEVERAEFAFAIDKWLGGRKQ